MTTSEGGVAEMLKMCVTGDPTVMYHFMKDFESQPQYGVKLDAKEYDPEANRWRFTLDVDYKPKVRKPVQVKLVTLSGKEIELNLLDGVVVELDEGVTYVSGKVFDVFN